MNLIPFRFSADRAVLAVLKFLQFCYKYPTFEGGFFIFSWQKKTSLHYKVRTTKLINMKVK